MSDDFVVVKSHPDLISYVDHLQRKNAEELSFYPKQTFEREAEAGRIYLGLLNGHPCGYIYAGAMVRDVKLHQVCIQYDARRRLYGSSLVQCLEHDCLSSGVSSINLRCAFDIDANDFWRSMGYGVIAVHDGGVRRMRRINVWRKQLTPELFEIEFIEPERGRQSSTIWARNKKTGIVNQFVRGKRMADYRTMILWGGKDETGRQA